jgi:hypothetical protein
MSGKDYLYAVERIIFATGIVLCARGETRRILIIGGFLIGFGALGWR